MKAIVTTSDINVVGPEGRSSFSTGVLEKILGDGHKVYLVTTRSKLCPTDDWWVKLVDSSKIFMGENLDFQKGWHDLFKALGHEWPTEEDAEPMFWTMAKSHLKRNESYIWGEDVKRSLR